MPIQQSFVELVLTRSQLETSHVRYILGSGHLASFAFALLRDDIRAQVTFISGDTGGQLHGRPIISLREFCANVHRDEGVILATYNHAVLVTMLAINQSHILDVRDLCASEDFAKGQSSPSVARLTVISVIPRSGTFRTMYFLFALNEILKGSAKSLCAHRLYAYRLGQWVDPASPYNLSKAFIFLNTDNFRLGHHVPPGSLALLSDNPAAVRLQLQRVARFSEACERHPCLSVLSHPLRPWLIEPILSGNVGYGMRFALIGRNVEDQITSILALYELLAANFKRQGAKRWMLADYVSRCTNRLRAFVLFSLDGLSPLIFEKALRRNVSFTDVVLDDGYLDSLILDYALQRFSCGQLEDPGTPTISARTFDYDEMIRDEGLYFLDLVSFLRGAPLDSSQQEIVWRAVEATNRTATRRIEADLGHSLSYHAGLEWGYETETHMTEGHIEGSDIETCRATVASKIRRMSDYIHKRLAQIMSDLAHGAQTGDPTIRLRNSVEVNMETDRTGGHRGGIVQ
jgi:hypothetical protein